MNTMISAPTTDDIQTESATIHASDSDRLALAQPARRGFLAQSAAGGLMVAVSLSGLGRAGSAAAQTAPTAPTVTAWISVGANETVTVWVPITEMGQGTSTGLAQIVADELRLDWSKVAVRHAPVDDTHGGTNASPWGRFTGGSLGLRLFFPNMQQAAANARQMLVQAAANSWGVSANACTVELASVKATVGGVLKTASYGSLADAASRIVLSGNAAVGQYPRQFVGTSAPRLDIPEKVTGAARFGIDVFETGMLFAAVRHSPTSGGTVGGIGSKPAGAIAMLAVGGVGMPGSANYKAPTGVAVVASNTWDAMRMTRSASVTWAAAPDLAARDSAAISARATWLMSNGSPLVAQSANPQNLPAALNAASGVVNASYQLPYLAHAALEPLNCSVRFTPATATAPGRCEVWAPTQAPDGVKATAAGLCPAGTVITVVNTLVGGGFGRKFEQDFVRESLQVGLACPGRLVKLTWPREEDFANDVYRPMTLSSIQAAASPTTGRITGWRNRIVGPSIGAQRGANPAAVDHSAVEGAVDLPYARDPLLVEYVPHDSPIPVGYWRSVGLSINTFAVESAMDELASSIGWDPIQFRLNNLTDARMINLLTTLRTFSGWTSVPAAGRARGVAIAIGFGSYIGQVAEVSVNAATGAVRVHRVSTVLDCGVAVNPGAIRAQIEGAVAMAMSATLWDQQTFVNGVAQARNYNKYRPVKLADMPQVDVQILTSGGAMGGVGEPGVPCVAPAIANAYARLVGAPSRKRSLPFFPGSSLGGL